MDKKKLEKIQKLYALASNNPNKNEAIVAAHKFINAISRDGLYLTISEQPQPTQQQIDKALKNNYEKGFTEGKQYSYNEGYQDGYHKGLNKNNKEQLNESIAGRPPSTTSTITFHNQVGIGSRRIRISNGY